MFPCARDFVAEANSVNQTPAATPRSAHRTRNRLGPLPAIECIVEGEMNKKRIIIAVIALVVIALIAAVLKRFGIGEGEKKSGPIAQVQIAKVQRKAISEKTIVYGSVVEIGRASCRERV